MNDFYTDEEELMEELGDLYGGSSLEDKLIINLPQDDVNHPFYQQSNNLDNKKRGSYTKRVFNEQWLKKFDFLIYDKDKNKMYCTICSKYSTHTTNPMIQGSQIFHINTLKQHSEGEVHKEAIIGKRCL